MRRHFRYLLVLSAWVCAGVSTASNADAQPYGISTWNTSGATGIACVSGPYVVSASAGEHSAGVPRTGGPYELTGGFWSGGAPTTLPVDQDVDFLPDAWEQTFGLAINCANGPDTASADPDGDGKTNAQELAEGTHPRGFFTRYLAEGAVNAFFHTDIAIANPDPANPALTLVRLQPEGGGAEKNTPVAVPAMAQRTVTRDTIGSLHTGAFSSIVESDRLVVVDRTMTWAGGGEYGASSETASIQPAATWYFAEGATGGPFDLFYLLQNPNDTAVDLEIKYLRALGESPLTKTYHLEPRSRRTIWVDEERFPDDGGTPLLSASDAAAVMQVTSGGPILVERAMYASASGEPFAAGHASAGIRAPATEWFLAEGATGSFFEMFILLANPGADEASVTAQFLLMDGTVLSKSYAIPGNGRVTIWVDEEELPAGSGIKPLSDVALSTTIKSDQPIVVERAMWWPQGGGWREGHSTAASTESATRWLTAGGEIGGTRNEQTYVLLANVDQQPAAVRVTILPESGAPIVWTNPNPIPPNSRFNVPIDASLFPGVSGRFAVLVESLGPASAKLVVERALYWDANGVTWGAGAASLATSVP